LSVEIDSGETNQEIQSISLATFHQFMTQVQRENISLEDCRNLLSQYGYNNKGSIPYKLFVNFITHTNNGLYDGKKQLNVYQDMNQPMSHYYIASSHNTYLEGDQLTSNSSIDRYISDLSRGCRCVELDCWDGEENNEPIVYHGHTLTTKIFFKDIIEAIRQFAFQKSSYPVILSLENHCSYHQQEKMAEHLTGILGDMLVSPELVDGKLPSPESLKYKIIIKGKRLPSNHEGKHTEGEVHNQDHHEQKDENQINEDKTNESKASSDEEDSEDEKHGESKENGHHHGVHPKLGRITLLGGVKFKSFEKNRLTAVANDMSSFSETKTLKLIEKHPEDWVNYNKIQMSRIYPAGFRIDSSNYDPVPSWNVGSQIVALNYQTSGVPMQVNIGKFRDNGGCGYLLKPQFLRDPTASFNPHTGPFNSPIQLNITVISGQYLPKPNGERDGEIIDPYVCIQLIGVPSDAASFKTRKIDDNGFNPQWHEQFSFQINEPNLAYLNFAVWDHDLNSDDFIASSVVPVNAIAEGFRTLQLYDVHGNKPQAFMNSSLFCYVQIGPVSNS